MPKNSIDIPLACQRLEGVFAPETAQRHAQIWKSLEQKLTGIDELETGYSFRFPLDDTLYRDLAEYVTFERLCCPFFNFNLEMDPAKELIRLGLTGGPGVKEFLAAEVAGRYSGV